MDCNERNKGAKKSIIMLTEYWYCDDTMYGIRTCPRDQCRRGLEVRKISGDGNRQPITEVRNES